MEHMGALPDSVKEWTDNYGPLVHTDNMGVDSPVFHKILENDDGALFPVCDATEAATRKFWGTLHVKHAVRIGTFCTVCFPQECHVPGCTASVDDPPERHWRVTPTGGHTAHCKCDGRGIVPSGGMRAGVKKCDERHP